MDYTEVLNYLYQQLPMFQRTGAAAYKSDLSNTIELCQRLGNPEKKFKSIHIAGTNGKGSVAHMLASVLQEQGYKTALFTSPHLKDFRERIKINGAMIPEDYVIEFVENGIDMFQDLKPSFFEYTFGMAASYFADEQVDYAIIETGMGGRLDSTNVVDPILTIITNIGLDHTQFLGESIEAIAGEKAGIIKINVPLIVGNADEAVKSIFISKCFENESPMVYAPDKFHSEARKPSGIFEVFDKDKNERNKIESQLGGIYQKENICTVFASVDVLNAKGVEVKRQALLKGITKVVSNTGLRGRWEVLGQKPLIICDTAHNEEGLVVVLNQLVGISYQKIHFVVGFVNDKKLDIILNLFPLAGEYYFCKPDIPRGLDATELKEKASLTGLIGDSYQSVADALVAAKKNASAEDIIYVGGSTFVVAEVIH